ncbi:sigma cross-reacting protein 27A [Deferribacter desulfuricans SSM1]|uniref:Sigma cross-reacting protein 27A n=1 Tax=Deferribacter desulfuricans (strain DSM 14783 / JCM 11476 / NBRC 101012 / SSM1) TaxID=639282 RepID=D3PE73_DEFDS|nr:isoprenoid biosynthesis glyoxalase ElbB [Deferribacter desulfuricans]BAI80896.1 sigma cross-reacting protein 27A [Deferribacter desulfuricans SSM1]
MAKVCVVLSGCGVYDGSEIHEAVLTMYFLDKYGAELLIAAPNKEQLHVVNHLTGEVAERESRNVLVESARIARGNIKDLKDVSADDFDALIFPGGFGAAKNLTTFAIDGVDCQIDPEVKRIVRETIEAKKPLAAICIAPVLVAKALEGTGIKTKITIGTDENVASAIENLGANHISCPVKEAVVDEENKIITTPAYMLGQRISEVAEGIEKTVKKLLDFVK